MMRVAYNLPAPVFGIVAWLVLWLAGCGSAPVLPAVEITQAHIEGSALVEGTVGAVPWGLTAEGGSDENGETAGKVCVTVWIWTHCVEVGQ